MILYVALGESVSRTWHLSTVSLVSKPFFTESEAAAVHLPVTALIRFLLLPFLIPFLEPVLRRARAVPCLRAFAFALPSALNTPPPDTRVAGHSPRSGPTCAF